MEKWSKYKLSVEHLCVFGCIAYVLIPYEKRVKLDEKSVKCVMFGVSSESKAYRLYDPVSKKILISKDVRFDEKKSWNWEENNNENDFLIDAGDEELTQSTVPIGEEERAESNGEQGEGYEPESNNEQGEARGLESVTIIGPQPAAVVNGPEKEKNRTEKGGSSQVTSSSSGSGRSKQRLVWMKDYVCDGMGAVIEEDGVELIAMFVTEDDPESFEEAIKHEKWRKAMEAEIKSIEENNTWELVDLPMGEKVIGVKWVFTTKFNERGEIDKFKARLVAKGFHQIHGVDFYEVFAPVARWDTIRLVLALATKENWRIFQSDVKSAFLHGDLSEDVYVEQPKGFESNKENEKVCKLKKALYGLRQAPRAWYSMIEGYFVREGFKKCYCEHTLFVKTEGENCLIVNLYVDDLIYTSNSDVMIEKFKASMKEEFSMTDLGKMKYFLGVEVIQDEEGIFISQKKYALDTLQKFGMDRCNSVKNPMVPGNKLTKDGAGPTVDPTAYKQLVGSLRYLTATRPDLIYSVNMVSRYMESPTEQHMLAAKRILRYVQEEAKANWWVLWTVIMQEMKMIGKVLRDTHFCLEEELCHGLRKNNQLLRYQQQKMSL